ncbi:MAG: threonine aldolase, partial [Psychromonas sp.]
GNPVRFVTHLGISRIDIETFLTVLKQTLKI